MYEEVKMISPEHIHKLWIIYINTYYILMDYKIANVQVLAPKLTQYFVFENFIK